MADELTLATGPLGRAGRRSEVRRDEDRGRAVRRSAHRRPPRRHQRRLEPAQRRKAPDFDATRGRDEFKKLPAELETRNKAKAAKKQSATK